MDISKISNIPNEGDTVGNTILHLLEDGEQAVPFVLFRVYEDKVVSISNILFSDILNVLDNVRAVMSFNWEFAEYTAKSITEQQKQQCIDLLDNTKHHFIVFDTDRKLNVVSSTLSEEELGSLRDTIVAISDAVENETNNANSITNILGSVVMPGNTIIPSIIVSMVHDNYITFNSTVRGAPSIYKFLTYGLNDTTTLSNEEYLGYAPPDVIDHTYCALYKIRKDDVMIACKLVQNYIKDARFLFVTIQKATELVKYNTLPNYITDSFVKSVGTRIECSTT